MNTVHIRACFMPSSHPFPTYNNKQANPEHNTIKGNFHHEPNTIIIQRMMIVMTVKALIDRHMVEHRGRITSWPGLTFSNFYSLSSLLALLEQQCNNVLQSCGNTTNPYPTISHHDA